VVEEAAEDAVVEAADATMAEVVVGTDTVATVVGIAAAADTRSRCQVLGVRSWGSTASFLRRAGPTGQKKQNEAAIRGSRLLYLRIQTV